MLYLVCRSIRTIVSAISYNAAFDVRDNSLKLGVVQAQNGRSVERHLVDEGNKCGLKFPQAGIMIQMLAVDVVDDGNGRLSFRKEPSLSSASATRKSPLPQFSMAAKALRPSSDDNCRVKSSLKPGAWRSWRWCSSFHARPDWRSVFKRMSSASISARGMTGICCAWLPEPRHCPDALRMK